MRAQVDIMRAHAAVGRRGEGLAGCAPEGLGLSGRRRSMATGAVRVGREGVGAREARALRQGHEAQSGSGLASGLGLGLHSARRAREGRRILRREARLMR